MPDLNLSIALERYDRHVPFFDGTVKPPAGMGLEVFQVGQSGMLRDEAAIDTSAGSMAANSTSPNFRCRLI